MKKAKIHFKPSGNWMNDPNGFLYYQGKYHLFYQHFPYAPVWGTMHWGHAVSEDLVNWEHQDVALFPTKYEDQNGCFSGSAVEHDGRMYLYYTGVHYNAVDRDNIHLCPGQQFEACQMMISSDDGFHFDNFKDKTVIIPCMGEGENGDRTHTRDPKVWRGENAWYMLIGSKDSDGNGQLLIYKSENLTDWEFANYVPGRNGFGQMWECPDYFETEGGKVLVISPMQLMRDGKKDADQTICMLVDFEEDTCEMRLPGSYEFIDQGLDLYAAQSTEDAQGRRVMLAWLRMPEAVDGAWSGMCCIPRVVEVKDRHVYFRVHPDIERQFTRRIASPAEADEAGYRVSLDLEDGESIGIGGYWIFRRGCHICTDRTGVFAGHDDYRMQFMTPELKDGCHLDIYVDRNLVEVYVNRGEYVVSNAVYGLGDEIKVDAKAVPQIDTLA